MVASVQCGTLRTRRPQPRWPLRRQRRSRRILAAAYSCGGLRCTARTRFESISGLVHQWRSLIPCGAISERRSVLPAGMRVAHRNNGKERYGRRHSQDDQICNPTPHTISLALTEGEPALRPHNFPIEESGAKPRLPATDEPQWKWLRVDPLQRQTKCKGCRARLPVPCRYGCAARWPGQPARRYVRISRSPRH